MTAGPWKKSSFCDTSACVEVAFAPEGNGTDIPQVTYMPDGDVVVTALGRPEVRLVYSSREWNAFVKGAEAKQFDVQVLRQG